MVSPKKQRPSAPEKPEKQPVSTTKSRSRPRLNISRTITPPEIPLLPMPEPVVVAEISLDTLPPKTPAVEGIFSPPSTEPSTSRPESKDTPPPGDLNAADQVGAGRPGRRARPQVSYKEPSLHTKMRRPDAKLVDAIVDRRTSVEPQLAPSTASKSTVKHEANEEPGWKPVSTISRRPGEDEAETGSPLRQKLDRRDTGQDSKSSPVHDVIEVKASTASKAISALINETSTAKRKAALPAPGATKTASGLSDLKHQNKPVSDEIVVKREEGNKDNMAIFDFTDSSPADTTANPRTRINELAKAARNARRHSSVPTSSLPEEHKADRPEKPEGALPSLHKRTVSGNVKSSSTTSLGKSTNSTRLNSTRDRKVSTLPPGSSSADLRAKIEAADEERKARETTALRAERAASRRKSMLL
jgi:hypothetical protein